MEKPKGREGETNLDPKRRNEMEFFCVNCFFFFLQSHKSLYSVCLNRTEMRVEMEEIGESGTFNVELN